MVLSHFGRFLSRDNVAPGAHAVVILDQAGWHDSAELVLPSSITLLPLPP
jgi:hypothetical protein